MSLNHLEEQMEDMIAKEGEVGGGGLGITACAFRTSGRKKSTLNSEHFERNYDRVGLTTGSLNQSLKQKEPNPIFHVHKLQIMIKKKEHRERAYIHGLAFANSYFRPNLGVKEEGAKVGLTVIQFHTITIFFFFLVVDLRAFEFFSPPLGAAAAAAVWDPLRKH